MPSKMKLNLIFLYSFNVLIYTMILQGEKKDGSDSLLFCVLQTSLMIDAIFPLHSSIMWHG